MYLVDANVLIRAAADYYPHQAIPEYWGWVRHMGRSNCIKIPPQIYDEIKPGPKDDPLIDWLREPGMKDDLVLKEATPLPHVRWVMDYGYGLNLTEDEVETVGQDPFLIAFAAAANPRRTVVTVENSQPSKQRANRKIPDVCKQLNIRCVTPFVLIRELGFKTSWQRHLQPPMTTSVTVPVVLRPPGQVAGGSPSAS